MRLILTCLVLFAAPAAAWEFEPRPVCTLRHSTDEVGVTVTYDPAIDEYAIALTLAQGSWPPAAAFGIRFEGARSNLIVTDRHQLGGAQGETLTVRDRGFGNVLDGLAFNSRAVALIGDRAVVVPLAGAGGPVEEFRACLATPTA